MYCGNCGVNNVDSAKFCKSCGSDMHGVVNSELSQSSTKKTTQKVLTIAGIILVGIGLFKVSVIGYYPSEAPFYFGMIIVGGICGFISSKIKTEE